jgi:probable O-glycosylation ligase (exosortase A-associated)
MVTALVLLPLERHPLRLPPLSLWVIAYLAWSFVGWGGSPYPNEVWDKITDLAKICGVVIVALNVLTTRERVRFFIIAFLGFFAFYPVRGSLFAYFLYGGTVEGRAAWNYIYSNPNDLAALCMLPLALAAGLLVAERERWIRYCAAAGAIVLPFVILLTQSRGAFIALSVFALAVFKGQKGRRGKILLIGGIIGVILAIAAPSSVWDRLGTISDVTNEQSAAKANDEGSARQRMEIWKVALTIARENPVTGVGLGGYPSAHYEYAQRPVFDPTALGHRDAHSTYIKLAAETGIVGFLIFMGMIAFTFVRLDRTRRLARATLPGRATQLFYLELGLTSYLIAGIWGSYQMIVLTYLYLTVAHVMADLTTAELTAAGVGRKHSRLRIGRGVSNARREALR